MANNAVTVYQYEQPRLPPNWNEAERRFYNRLIQVLDDIYSKYGRIDEKMLSSTVRQKIIGSAESILLVTGKVEELGEAVETVQASAENAEEVANAALMRDDFIRIIRVLDDGLHVGDNLTTCEVLISSTGVSILINGVPYSKFTAEYVQFGNYQLKLTADGGMAFKMV